MRRCFSCVNCPCSLPSKNYYSSTRVKLGRSVRTPSHWWMPPKRRCRPGPRVLFFVSSTLSASSRSCASDFSGRAYLCARASHRGRLGPPRRLAASDPRKVKEGAGDARRDDGLLHDLTRHTDNDVRPVRLLGAGPYGNLADRRRRDDVARRVGGVVVARFPSNERVAPGRDHIKGLARPEVRLQYLAAVFLRGRSNISTSRRRRAGDAVRAPSSRRPRAGPRPR